MSNLRQRIRGSALWSLYAWWALSGYAWLAEAGIRPADLRCESGSNPLGIDTTHPRLSWKLVDDNPAARGQRQTAYQVLVASAPEKLVEGQADLWDSSRVTTDQTLQVTYAGRPVKSSQRVCWTVRTWDQDGNASAWGEPAWWTMGIMDDADWRASWIGEPERRDPGQGKGGPSATVLLRREFAVKPGLQRAVVHVCGLGHYEMSLNGRRVSDDLLAPGWTKYDKTCLYDTYEITPLLREGENAVGLLLGNGMYNVTAGRYYKFQGSFGPLKAISQIRLEYADGTTEVIGTDDRWQTAPGPITFSCVFGGEDHDARLEQEGWDGPHFDSSRWARAVVVKAPGGRLKGYCYAAPPIRIWETLRPTGVHQLKPGVAVYDLGQNASLIPRLTVRGPAGSVVKITPAELVRDDGSVDRQSCGGGEAYWKYTLADSSPQTWFPKFFYHGCRYLEVECSAPAGVELPVVQSLEGVVVHSASSPIGQFDCSDELFPRIRTLIRWAQRSNMMHVITDCPHRERLGWLEQYHLNGPSLRYEFDLARLFSKGMSDMADSQLENGLVPDIAPEYVVFSDGFRDSPEWGSAFILAPWQQYEWTGDVELLRTYYPRMKRYVAYLAGRSRDHVVSHGLGDWYDLGPNPPGQAQLTPVPLTATAFYYLDTLTLARIATILSHEQDAKDYRAQADAIRAAFNKAFFKAETRQYATGSQCANAMALVLDLAEPQHRQSVLEAVVHDVRSRGNALTAGDVGYRYLLRALADGARSDVIFDMNHQSDKPGYGFQLNRGATSLTEAWDAGRASSQNHFMLGHIMEWFYHDLAGIGCDPSGPGFHRIQIRPQPVGGIAWTRASVDSVRGRISSHWQIAGGEFRLTITIPVNTTATVYVPTSDPKSVTEGGKPAHQAPGVRPLPAEGGAAVFAVQSGQYCFVAPAHRAPAKD